MNVSLVSDICCSCDSRYNARQSSTFGRLRIGVVTRGRNRAIAVARDGGKN